MIEDLLAEYTKPDTPLRAAVIYELSGISSRDVEVLTHMWPTIPEDRRERLMARLVEVSESDSDLDFLEVAKHAIKDENLSVRRDAINLLWTCDEPWVLKLLIDRASNDVSTDVRSAAAAGLGRFVLLGELGDFPADLAGEAEDTLLRILTKSQPTSDVYRRALESIAYSGRDEVTKLIEAAALQPNTSLQASAICAMGRWGDERWNKSVLAALVSQEPEIKFEAVRAAGEMEIEESVPLLIDLYREQDREINQAVVWALGEIGGIEAQRFLTSLLSDESDVDLISDIEDALALASLPSVNFRTIDRDQSS